MKGGVICTFLMIESNEQNYEMRVAREALSGNYFKAAIIKYI